MPTVFVSDGLTKRDAGKLTDPTESFGGRVRRAYFEKTLPGSGLATGDSIRLCTIPKGARVLWGQFAFSAAQGATATTAVGIAGATGKYRAAAVTNATTPFGIGLGEGTAVGGLVTTAEEEILATNAAAAWTASSVLKGFIDYVTD